MAEIPQYMSDNAIIEELIRDQKRTRRQATCAVNALKRFGYGPAERYHMLKDPNNNVHLLCYFGNIWFAIFLGLVIFLIFVFSVFKIGERIIVELI